MANPLRTPPVLARLAYRKSVISRTMVFLRRQYLGDEMSGPKETLICEEVFPVDSRIPPEEIQSYLEYLTEEVAELDRQIRSFQIVAPAQGHHEQKRQKGSGQQHQKGSQGYRQGGRSG